MWSKRSPGCGAVLLASAVLLAGAIAPAGCTHTRTVPDTITRRLGGQRYAGHFVSPYSYEWFVRGELALTREDYSQAIEAYRRALAGSEQDVLVLSRLALALTRLGQTRQAQAVLKRAAALDRHSESVWITRGQLAEKQGRWDAALVAYGWALARAPHSDSAASSLGRVLERLGARERALAVLAASARMHAGAPLSPTHTRLLNSLVAQRPARLLSYTEASASAETAPGDLMVSEAKRALATGRPATAVRLLDAIGDPSVARALRLEAWLHAGHRARAENLLVLEPLATLGIPSELARAYLRLDRPERASELARAAWSASADHATLLALVEAELVLENYREATRQLGRVLRAEPALPGTRAALRDCLVANGLQWLANELGALPATAQ